MRPPRDHVRLARAFGIAPTRSGFAIVSSATLGAIGLAAPPILIPAAAIVAGLGGIALDDRRAIAKGLREVDTWGFPVDGYRAWLLANEPAFDIELQRDVDIQIVATSVAAIDAAVVVERKSDRVFRIVTRRIAIPGKQPTAQPLFVGDRRLLGELHQRILAPLHADVGIVTMRMGDHATLAALVASQRTSTTTGVEGMGGAFREQAMGAPPALQALVHSGNASRRPPQEARSLRQRAERVMHAANASPSGLGTVIAITFGGMTVGGQVGVAGVGVGAVAGFIGGIAAVVTGNRQKAKSVARAALAQGFPVEGYDDWLISGRPLLDVELAAPIDRAWLLERLPRLTAWSISSNSSVPWVEDVTWLDETLVRIETRPTLVEPPGNRIAPFYGGSQLMFRSLVVDVLQPLHEHVGIVAVRMGGYIDRRV